MAFSLTAVNAATLERINNKFTDNLSTKTPLQLKFTKNGGRWLFSGGSDLKFPIISASGNAGSYRGDDTLNINRPEGLIALTYNVKQFYSSVTMVGLEEVLNAGDRAEASVFDGRMKQAEITTIENFETMLFADGTGNVGGDNEARDWNGLQNLVADNPTTGTIGGQSRATNSQLRNKTYTTAVTAFNTASAGRIGMLTLYADCVNGERKPNFITTTSAIWVLYNISLQANERFVMSNQDKDLTNAGFENVAFMTAPVTMSSACPASHLYMLRIAEPRSDGGIFLAISRERNFKMMSFIQARDQDVRSALVLTAGELATDAPYLNGVMTNITG